MASRIPQTLIDDASAMFCDGMTYPQIAGRLRCTVKRVAYMLEKSGVKRTRPEVRSKETADEVVARALEAAKHRPCVWL